MQNINTLSKTGKLKFRSKRSLKFLFFRLGLKAKISTWLIRKFGRTQKTKPNTTHLWPITI